MGERTAICYPDGRRAAYEYNEAMQLSALKLLSDDAQEKTILYSYDEAGRLTGKQFPGGNRTDYSYNGAGKSKRFYIPEQTLQNVITMIMMLWEIRSWLKRETGTAGRQWKLFL